MATITIDDISKLKRSSVGRSDIANADGNIYYDLVNKKIQLLTRDEVPTVNGQPNALIRAGAEKGGLTGEVLTQFNYEERKRSEDLQFFYNSIDGALKEVGEYFTTFGWEFDGDDTTGDIKLLRGTGATYRSLTGEATKIFVGVESLQNLSESTQARYQLDLGGQSFDFFFKGNVNEPVLVYDVATSFDKRAYISVEIADAGLVFSKREYTRGLGGFSITVTAGESKDGNITSLTEDDGSGNIVFTGDVPNLTSSDFIITEETADNFEQGTGNFFLTFDNTTRQLPINTIAAALQKMKLNGTTLTFSLDDGSTANIDVSRIGNFFEYDSRNRLILSNPLFGYENLLPAGRTVSPSFFIKGVLPSDDQRVVFTSDDETERSYQFLPTIRIDFGALTSQDTDAYYRVMPFDRVGDDDFTNTTAVTSKDADGVTLSGDISGNQFLEYKTSETGKFIVIASGVNTLASNNQVFEVDGETAVTPVICQLARRTA